nr:hypothetical protein [Oribacterium sp.]
MRKILSTILTVSILATTLAGCGGGSTTQATTAAAPAETKAAAETQAPAAGGTEEKKTENLTGIDAIIAEAETMSLEELAKKAIEESNGKTFYGVGNS